MEELSTRWFAIIVASVAVGAFVGAYLALQIAWR